MVLTKSGTAVAVSGAGFLAAGVLANYPEFVSFGLTCAGVVVLAVLWTLVPARITAVRDVRPDGVSVGFPAHAVLTVRNIGRRRSPPLLARERCAGYEFSVRLPGLAPGGSGEVVYRLPTDRRGRFTIEPLSVGRVDPLRLRYAQHWHGSSSVFYVRPTVHDVAPLPVQAGREGEGRTSGSAPRGGVAFHSLRPYEWGDDRRLIHWLSSARTGTLLVRHNVVVDDPRQVIVLNTCVDSYDGELFEEAVRVAASLCVAANRSGFPLELWTTNGQAVRAEAAAGEVFAVLNLLAAVQRSQDDVGLAALMRLVPASDHTALGVVTGRVSLPDLALLSSLRPRFLSVSIACLTRDRDSTARGRSDLSWITSATSADFAVAWNALMRR
jgi:uncharacterized protein (DUF58 family)